MICTPVFVCPQNPAVMWRCAGIVLSHRSSCSLRCGCRLNASHKAAERYIAQFPSASLNHVARFVAFVAGSFAALLLFAALVDDVLLERHLFGRTIVWCGTVPFAHVFEGIAGSAVLNCWKACL